MTPPRVTVVVPTQNRADLLAEALESVAAQDYQDWECVVVDDGSTDDTPQVIEGFRDRDSRFRYLRHDGGSAARSRNLGIEAARGGYVAFLDDDDLYTPDRLAWQVDVLDGDPGVVLVYGHTVQFRDDEPGRASLYLGRLDHRPHGDAFEQLLTCSAIYSPLVRRDALVETGGFDTSLPSAEDWDLWLSLSRAGRIHFEPRIALRYRVHPGSKSRHVVRNYRCAWRVARKHISKGSLPERIRLGFAVWRYFRSVYPPFLLRYAREASATGPWREARSGWRAFAGLLPRALLRPRPLAWALWALMPFDRPPPWRRLRERIRKSRLGSSPAGRRLSSITRSVGTPRGRHRLAAHIRGRRLIRQWRRRMARLGQMQPGRPVTVIGLVEHLGDIVAAEPVVRYLRRRTPEAHLVWAVRPAYRELVEAHPGVDEVLEVGCLTEWIVLAGSGALTDPVDLHLHGRTCDRCLVRVEQPPGRREATVANYYAVDNLLGAFCRAAGLEPIREGPELHIPRGVADRVSALDLPDRYLVIHGRSNQAARDWDMARWSELVRRITGDLRLPVVEVGHATVVHDPPAGYRNLCGRTGLLETAEVIRRSTVFVGIDSGPAHMANAMGSRAVLVFGTYRGYDRYMPYSGAYARGDGARILRAEGPAATLATDRVFDAVAAEVAPEVRVGVAT